MTENKIWIEYSSQNLLFNIWKYGLILPVFTYNHSEGVFKYTKSYSRFFNLTALAVLTYIIMHSTQILEKSSVMLFITYTYNSSLFFNTWCTIILIYFAVGNIEKMSEKMKTLIRLKNSLGICGYTDRRIETTWLIYVVFLQIMMLFCDISMSIMDDHYKIAFILNMHFYYILDIQFLQLLICFKSAIIFNLQQLNTVLRNGYQPSKMADYKSFIDESKMVANEFISFSSYMTLNQCFYITYSIVLSIFMNMENSRMYFDYFAFLISCVSNSLWFFIEASIILFDVNQDVGMHKEVCFFSFIQLHLRETNNILGP